MKSIKYMIALASFVFTAPTYAQLFELNFEANPAIPAQIRSTLQSEILNVEKEINEGLPSAQPDRLMEGMANASVMSGKGVGSDYASNMEVFLIGAGIGVGADLEKDPTTDSDISGLGAQGGIVIGTNLGWTGVNKILGLDPKRLNVYMNFFSKKIEREMDESDISADLSSFGIHASYLWKKGNSSKMFGWGGLKIHGGIERNKSTFKFSQELNESINESGSIGGQSYTASGTITGRPEATIEAATTSIPLEISTSVQLLYVLSVYTGLGVDYNMGYAEGKGSLNALPSTINCTGAACNGEDTVGTVSPEANIDSKGKVTPFTTRGFAGVQFNLPFFYIFAQVDKAFGNELIGATAGARFVY